MTVENASRAVGVVLGCLVLMGLLVAAIAGLLWLVSVVSGTPYFELLKRFQSLSLWTGWACLGVGLGGYLVTRTLMLMVGRGN